MFLLFHFRLPRSSTGSLQTDRPSIYFQIEHFVIVHLLDNFLFCTSIWHLVFNGCLSSFTCYFYSLPVHTCLRNISVILFVVFHFRRSWGKPEVRQGWMFVNTMNGHWILLSYFSRFLVWFLQSYWTCCSTAFQCKREHTFVSLIISRIIQFQSQSNYGSLHKIRVYTILGKTIFTLLMYKHLYGWKR